MSREGGSCTLAKPVTADASRWLRLSAGLLRPDVPRVAADVTVAPDTLRSEKET